MGIPNYCGTSNRSCNSVMPTFTSLLLSRVSQHARGQVLKSNPSPSPFFHHFPLVFFFSGRRRALLKQRSFVELLEHGGAFRLGSMIPKVVPLVLPVLLPCTVSSLTFQPSSSDCNKVIRLFSFVEKDGRYCCSPKFRASRRTSRRPQVFPVLAIFPPLQYPLRLGRSFPNNLPLHPPPFFSIWLRVTIACS